MKAHFFVGKSCRDCGMRTHWPGASDECQMPDLGKLRERARVSSKKRREKNATIQTIDN